MCETILAKHPLRYGYVLNDEHDGYYKENGEAYPKNMIITLFVHDIDDKVYVYTQTDYFLFEYTSILTIEECRRLYNIIPSDFNKL